MNGIDVLVRLSILYNSPDLLCLAISEGTLDIPVSIQIIRTYLFVWIHIYTALDTFLSHVGPAVPRHPLPLALGTFVFSEASLLTLVGCQALTLWPSLQSR